MSPELLAQLDRDGYCFLRQSQLGLPVESLLAHITSILTSATGDSSILAGSSGPAYGARNVLRLWAEVTSLVRGNLADAVLRVLGNEAAIVRGLYFDKPPGHSWALPWHRDYTIAVKEHRPSTRFTKPTVKSGVPHYEAPEELLQSMLTLRIHLDAMTPDNGPLRVVPGSHRSASDETRDAVTLNCEAGDVLLIRPLVLHASGHSTAGTDQHRRILHLECANVAELPDGLLWDRHVRIRTGATSSFSELVSRKR
jgi:hypothetical protein